VCHCGCEKPRIGQDSSEQLEYQPRKLFVVRHIYPKYACSCCKEGVARAPAVANPIAGGLAGPGLLAHWLLLGLHQARRPRLHGVRLPRLSQPGRTGRDAQVLNRLEAFLREQRRGQSRGGVTSPPPG
jgi:transposase